MMKICSKLTEFLASIPRNLWVENRRTVSVGLSCLSKGMESKKEYKWTNLQNGKSHRCGRQAYGYQAVVGVREGRSRRLGLTYTHYTLHIQATHYIYKLHSTYTYYIYTPHTTYTSYTLHIQATHYIYILHIHTAHYVYTLLYGK